MDIWSLLPFDTTSDDAGVRAGEDRVLEIKARKVDVDEARRKLETYVEAQEGAAPDDDAPPAMAQADLHEARWREELREFNAVRLRALGSGDGVEDEERDSLEQVFEDEKRNLLERLDKFESSLETVSESHRETMQEGAEAAGAETDRLAAEADRLRTCYEIWESLYETSRRQFVVNRFFVAINGSVGTGGVTSMESPNDDTGPVSERPSFDELRAEIRHELSEQARFDEGEDEQLLLKAIDELVAPIDDSTTLAVDELTDEVSIGRGHDIEADLRAPDEQDDEFAVTLDDIEAGDSELEDSELGDEG